MSAWLAEMGACLVRGEALLVEDNGLIAMDAELMLLALGCTACHLAASVAAALAILQDRPIACAMLDIELGGESCAAVASELHARGIPFIFASGYRDLAERIPEFAWVPLVGKPYDMRDVGSAFSLLDQR